MTHDVADSGKFTEVQGGTGGSTSVTKGADGGEASRRRLTAARVIYHREGVGRKPLWRKYVPITDPAQSQKNPSVRGRGRRFPLIKSQSRGHCGVLALKLP
jgi:hypothetical protein